MGLDLISIYKHMGWYERAFVFYLVLVLVLSFFRSMQLIRKLWTISQIAEGLRPSFKYQWEANAANIAVMRNLAILTLILSVLVPSYALMQNFTDFVLATASIVNHAGGDFDFAGGPARLFIPIVLGLAVSAVVYALSSFYADVLARRRVKWNILIAKVSDRYNVG